jgi:hypothetical protein
MIRHKEDRQDMLALTDNTERRQRSMAVAFLQELPGATQEQYDQVVETLRGQTAQGRIFHVAGPIEGGWRIVDVWESQEAVNTFFQEQLGPAAQAAGMAAPPPQFWPVHNMLSGPEHYLYSAS